MTRPTSLPATDEHQRFPLTERIAVLMAAIIIMLMLLPIVLDAQRRESGLERSVPRETPARRAAQPKRTADHTAGAPGTTGKADSAGNAG
jgi:hypothetical protein